MFCEKPAELALCALTREPHNSVKITLLPGRRTHLSNQSRIASDQDTARPASQSRQRRCRRFRWSEYRQKLGQSSNVSDRVQLLRLDTAFECPNLPGSADEAGSPSQVVGAPAAREKPPRTRVSQVHRSYVKKLLPPSKSVLLALQGALNNSGCSFRTHPPFSAPLFAATSPEKAFTKIWFHEDTHLGRGCSRQDHNQSCAPLRKEITILELYAEAIFAAPPRLLLKERQRDLKRPRLIPSPGGELSRDREGRRKPEAQEEWLPKFHWESCCGFAFPTERSRLGFSSTNSSGQQKAGDRRAW